MDELCHIEFYFDNAHYKKTCWLKSYFFQFNRPKGQQSSRKNTNIAPKFLKRYSAFLKMEKKKKAY